MEVYMPTVQKSNIQIDKLLFDPENPRLPKSMQGITDEKTVVNYLVTNGNITELMLSIVETGYSESEPLLVVPKDDKFIVVEGNRRLAALKVLSTPTLSDVRANSIHEIISRADAVPTEIPCIIYSSRDDILDYLGYRHITGVKDWGAFEKARYLDQLFIRHQNEGTSQEVYNQIAHMIGSKSNYVKKLHISLKLYDFAENNSYYGLDIDEDDKRFSWLTLALGNTSISSYIGLPSPLTGDISALNEDHFRKFFCWLYSKNPVVVKESRNISDLAIVIACPAALEQLENGTSLDECLLYTSEPNDRFLKMLSNAKQQLFKAQETLILLTEEPEGAANSITEIKKCVNSLEVTYKNNFASTEDASVLLQKLASNPELVSGLLDLLGKNKE